MKSLIKKKHLNVNTLKAQLIYKTSEMRLLDSIKVLFIALNYACGFIQSYRIITTSTSSAWGQVTLNFQFCKGTIHPALSYQIQGCFHPSHLSEKKNARCPMSPSSGVNTQVVQIGRVQKGASSQVDVQKLREWLLSITIDCWWKKFGWA